MIATKKKAWDIVGGLSKPSKMPCLSTGISAFECQTGSKLAKITGTPCSQCYAKQGSYTMYPAVAVAHERRLQAIDSPLWVDAMVMLLGKESHFRWFDSGDIQSLVHLHKIVEVARKTPNCLHWLPTQERKYVESYTGSFPSNLIIRISQVKIDSIPVPSHALSSMVTTSSTVPSHVSLCHASKNEGKCGDCRNCWNANIQCIAYPSHGHSLLTIKKKG